MPAVGTNAKCRDVRYSVAIEGKADDICSMRVLPRLTYVGHEWSLFAAMHVGVLAGAAQQIGLRVRHAFYPKFNASVIIPHLRRR
jgi:hypothetical protein